MRKESKENQPIPDNDSTTALPAYSQRDTGSTRPVVVEDLDQVIGRKSNSRHQQKAFVRQPPIIPTSTLPQPLKTQHSKSTSLSLRAETMSPIESGPDDDSDKTPTRPTFDLARQSRSYSSSHTYSFTGERPAQKEKEDYNPVLSALAFQSRLLSPDPKPRIPSQTQSQNQLASQSQSQPHHIPTTTTPPRQTRSVSTSGSHTIDGYGPPQPPTVSPVSAERKAAIAAAERRRSLQGQGNGSPGRRVPGSPGRHDGSPGKPSPSRDMVEVASRGRISPGGSPMRTPGASSTSRSPGDLQRPDQESSYTVLAGGSWASRSAAITPAKDATQQKEKAFAHLSPRREIVADTSRDDPQTPSQAKMRYSPKRGQWVAAGKHDDEQDGNKALSTDNLSTDKQPIQIEMKTTTSTTVLGRSPSAPKVGHSVRSPFDFTFLQPVPTAPVTSDPVQMKQQAGLGLGRPGLGMPKRSSSEAATNGPSIAKDSPRDKRRVTSSENESLAGVFPTLFISQRGAPAKNLPAEVSSPGVRDMVIVQLTYRNPQNPKSTGPSRFLASSALSHGRPLPNPFLSPPSARNLVDRLEPGRRVVSEPLPIIDAPAEAVATGFANFISNSRIVSEPTPLPKLQQNVNNATRKRNRNKQAKQGFPNPEPVVHSWTSLKEKFEFPTLPITSGSGSKDLGGDDGMQLYDTKSDKTERPICTRFDMTKRSMITNPDTRKPTITKPKLNEKQQRPDDSKPKTKLTLHDSLPGSNVTHSRTSSAARHQRDEPPHTAITNSYKNKITQTKLKNDPTYKHPRSSFDDNATTQTTNGTAKSDQDHMDVPAPRRGSDSQARDRKRVDKVNSKLPSAWTRAKQQPAEQSQRDFAGHIYDVSSTGHTLI
jgi:hypothetical protein